MYFERKMMNNNVVQRCRDRKRSKMYPGENGKLIVSG
jgi:hypothetical protein